MKRFIRYLCFLLIFDKEERRAIREGLKYGEMIWFDSFKESDFQIDWMNERRNYFSRIHDDISLFK